MSETERTRRRRWPWLLLATAVLLIGGWAAWRFRPLNAVERRLVGTWVLKDGGRIRLRFSETRQFDGMAIRVMKAPEYGTRYVFEPIKEASWTASGNRIELRVLRDAGAGLPILTRLSLLFRNLAFGENRVEMSVTIEDQDRIVVSHYVLHRVPE